MVEDDSREAVARRLEAIRAIEGLSKKDFAEKAGVAPQSYNGYTNGTRELSFDAARRFRKTYGLPLEFIVYGNPRDLPLRYAAAASNLGG